jgi:glycosyltransferase involved in cell wall biosynthesis
MIRPAASKVCYVTRNVAPYRVPIFRALAELLPSGLVVVCGSKSTRPEEVAALKLSPSILVYCVDDDVMFGPRHHEYFANSRIVIPIVPSLLPLLIRINPDVVIGDGFFQWTGYALLYRILMRKALVVCYERTRYTERRVQWYRRAYRHMALKFCGGLAVNGLQTEQYLNTLGVPAARMFAGQMTTDLSFWNRPYSHGERERNRGAVFGSLPLGSVVFVCVGSLAERKGVIPLLNAWISSGLARRADCGLVFAGTGPQKQQLEDIQKSNKVTNVVLLGSIDSGRLRSVYNASDIAICPTLEDNWSLVVPEAMASGLPVCCSTHNGVVPDLVVDGLTGFVFDPTDASSIQKVLQKVVADRASLSELGAAARNRSHEYTPERAARAILNAVAWAEGAG